MFQLDLNILYFFNQTLAASWLDPIMVYVTDFGHWIPVYIFATGFLLWRFRWRGLRLVIAAMVVIAVSDLLTNRIIKQVVARERPCADNGAHLSIPLRLPDGMRCGYGFPSSHAVNNFAVIVFFMLLFPKNRKLWWLIVPAIIPPIS